MFPTFNEAEKAVHYPADRRMFVGLQKRVYIIIGILLAVTVGVAWLQYLIAGLPPDPSLSFKPPQAGDPVGFPAWLRL